jgi:catechol 2,3-dioxygenase-like lactoylglutathione lyase family enzyme
MIEDFQHICITCRDLKRSIQFYERLGLTVIDPVLELDEDGIARAFQLPKGHLKVVHLAPPGATGKMFIDLVQWVEPSSTGEPYPALDNVGINRLAFRVSDIDATTVSLRERGITFLSEEPQSFGGIRTIITTDPDGVFIQLLEWL